MLKGLRRSIIGTLAVGIACVGFTTAFAADIVRITGIPDENPTELQRKYKPMVDYLSMSLNAEVEYVPVTDYGAAVAALAAGKVDFAWLGGFTHVQARIMAGASPVVMRDIDRQFKSVIIANTNSGVGSTDDIKGMKFAFGSKSSTSGHLMPRYFLDTLYGIDVEKDLGGSPVYSGSHDATVKVVESGKVDVGALNAEVWNRMSESGAYDKSKVVLIETTPDYVDYVWTARDDIEPEMVDKFRQAFLSLDNSNTDHQKVLKLQGAEKFVLAAPEDFDSIEAVGRSTGLLK
ncbi:putative selenate ABC transporter substrate-binding protein [Chromatiales bacterium (ex Bugula neritina AB1)]|nr:putative selenate ABC transporter substrate-binding protein [Chromatiales bacterium (ex Bugula neritina AB1)]